MAADVGCKMSFDGNDLGASAEQGRESSAAAIGSLKAIAFGLAEVCMNIQGHAHPAAEAVHDHPRTDLDGLGPSVYHPLFSPARGWKKSVRNRWVNPSSPLQRVHRTRFRRNPGGPRCPEASQN